MQVFQAPWSPEAPIYKFELLEEQPINTTLTTLHATDVDSTISVYKIIGDDDNGNKYFQINNITNYSHLLTHLFLRPHNVYIKKNFD